MIRHNEIEIDNERRTIKHRGALVRFNQNRSFSLLKHLILSGHKNIDELFDLVYNEPEDGGPLSGTNGISVLLTQNKKYYEQLDLVLSKERGAHAATRYWLEPKKEEFASG